MVAAGRRGTWSIDVIFRAGGACAGDLDLELSMDRHAAESDGVLLVNGAKPHTDFLGSLY